jgi:ComF family protein
MERLSGTLCRICSARLQSEDARVCGECLARTPRFKRAVCFSPYEDPMREAIHLLKFRGIKRLARPLGLLLATLELPEADVIVPVPSGLMGLRARGFNQCYFISRELSRLTAIPVESRLLFKKKETPPQVGLSALARRTNLRGAFAMRGRLEGERVLLVDDVITTGTTMNECAKTLRRAGTSEVTAVALARA